MTLALAGATDFVTVEGTAVADRGYHVERSARSARSAKRRCSTRRTPSACCPRELINNGQVKNFKEASKYLPLVEFQEMQGSEILVPQLAGCRVPTCRRPHGRNGHRRHRREQHGDSPAD